MTILAVDDSAADRKLVEWLLRAAGEDFEFREASTASGGLSAWREYSPDCVLVNYKLPGMTGIDFLKRLRALEDGRGPAAVIMLSGIVSEQVAVDAMKAGAQDFLMKDRITAERLRLAVENAIEKAGLEKALKLEHERLTQSLVEKEVLIKEVHHRVKNNLQVIASLLRLQAEAVKNNSSQDQDVAGALLRSQHRVESMAQLHEQLYLSEVGQVELARQAGMLLSHLLESYGAVRVAGKLDIAPLPDGSPLVIGANEAIPTGLILNELISNALKHAFADGRPGTLTVSAGLCNDRIVIAVRDNGVGAPEDLDLRRPRSLGLQIVTILARQLKGSVEMKRGRAAAAQGSAEDAAGGTTFLVSFPERK